MPASAYVRRVREAIGHGLLLLPAVAAVIRDDAGRVLLMQHAESGRWSLPAGAIEPGESPAAVDGEASAFRWAEPEAAPSLLALPYPAHLFDRDAR